MYGASTVLTCCRLVLRFSSVSGILVSRCFLSVFIIATIANGIIVGIFVHLAILLYKTSKPAFVVTDDDNKLTVKPRLGFYYPAAEAIENEVERLLTSDEISGKVLEFDFEHIDEIDSGLADTIKHSVHYLKSINYDVNVINASVSLAYSCQFQKLTQNQANVACTLTNNTVDCQNDEEVDTESTSLNPTKV